MRGEARNPRIELRVGEAPLGGEIDHRRHVRRPASEMGDPVVVANRQGLLLRYAVLRRLIRPILRHFVQLRRRIGRLSCVEWLLLRRHSFAFSPRVARHCEPTGRANARPMTGSAKQSMEPRKERMDCFVASLLAMTSRRESALSRSDAPEL